MPVDPFAAAQVAGSAGTAIADKAAPAPVEDPFVSSHDLDDPFATSSDFRGGDFTPSPPIESMRNRLVVMIPREFDPKSPNPFKVNASDPDFREQYTVDLYVLDGGAFSFPYRIKADAERGIEAETKDWDGGNPSAETPFVARNFWVPQGNIINKLKQTHRKGAPYLGVIDIVPRKKGREAGQTAASIRKEYDAWVARNRVGSGPLIAWAMDDPSPERRKIAIAWWAANKNDIAAINTSTAPAS